MGYTHYWNHRKGFTDEEWTRIVDAHVALLQACHQEGIPLSIEEDDSVALAVTNHALLAERTALIADEDARLFVNGVGDDAHETFVITRQGPSSGEGTFDFCKTRQKPYDTYVTAMLSILSSWFPEHIDASSDGDDADWEDGLMMARRCCGTTITLPRDVSGLE